jgi:signal transduction histidine kinase/ActR/RegA family two-component response regulator
MASRSISIKTQFLCTIVGSIVVTAVALTTLAYQAQTANLERDARRAVRVAAQSRAAAIDRLVDDQQQRAQRFLIAAASLCGEQTPSGRIAWELGCAQRALREFRASERALGVLLTNGRRRIARGGAATSDNLPVPSPLARVVDDRGEATYVIFAENKGAAVRLVFSMRDLAALFEQPLGLLGSGEVFLRKASGGVLTPLRYNAPQVAAFAEASYPCASPSEWIDIDYRGVNTVHGIHPLHTFAQPLCVDAHVSREEAFAPASALLVGLVTRATLFAFVGVLLALIAAHWMSVPVQRLAASARALEIGDFGQPISNAGPSEIRALARAFATMSHALGEEMAREQRARLGAETANRAKDEFLAVLSHELRTPLTSTLGWARLLRHGHLEPAQTDHAISAIERSAQRQKRLIEDLLDVSRIIAGRLVLEPARLLVTDPVRAAIQELRPIADEKGIILDTTFDAEPRVTADGMRIQQIVTNLLTNAIKFTPSGGRVNVHVTAADRHAVIAFSDTGIGIPAEFLPHMFEPFRQADVGPRRAHGGLGLGLSIVHHLVKLHSGTVEATSQGPGTGTTFVVRLPLTPSDAMQPARGVETARGETIAGGGFARTARLDRVRVLVVDDDDDARHLVAALLHDAGAQVDEVATAAEGRQRLGTHRYSAIVSDIVMPEEDGYAFMRAVRALSATVPAVALTTLTRAEDAAAAYTAGYQICLTKPIDRDRLIAAVAELTRCGSVSLLKTPFTRQA